MNKSFRIIIINIIICVLTSVSVNAQTEDDLILDLSRDFGYSSGTGKIQGTFSMRVRGPSNLIRVEFLIDGEIIAEINESPFRFQFNTDTYGVGIHTLSAVGYTEDGRILNSNTRRVEFVSAQEGPEQVIKIILPIFAVIFLIAIVSILIPTLTGKGNKVAIPLGVPRSYGISGGAICPKCGRPFSIHFFGFNLLMGKLDRCPHCGRWSIVRRASPQELRSAELAELDQASLAEQEFQQPEADRLKKELDESKYHDI